MKTAYDQKIADIESFMAESADPAGVESTWQVTRKRLNRLNGELAESAFCCNDGYTMADVILTVIVPRQVMLAVDPCVCRPALRARFERMKRRPSDKTSDVRTRFEPEVKVSMLVMKFTWQVLGVLLLCGIFAVGLLML